MVTKLQEICTFVNNHNKILGILGLQKLIYKQKNMNYLNNIRYRTQKQQYIHNNEYIYT